LIFIHFQIPNHTFLEISPKKHRAKTRNKRRRESEKALRKERNQQGDLIPKQNEATSEKNRKNTR
jgi:hypothetical protein